MPIKTPRFEGLKPASSAVSKVMSRNRHINTSCEILLRSALWKLGLRFRKNVATLPGKPDVVFAPQRVAIFCDGDFWHGKDWGSRRRKLKHGHNAKYWIAKIKANMARDQRNRRFLERQGWTVLRFWESNVLADPERTAQTINTVIHKFAAKQIGQC